MRGIYHDAQEIRAAGPDLCAVRRPACRWWRPGEDRNWVSKVASFVLFVDYSGYMAMSNADASRRKIEWCQGPAGEDEDQDSGLG
jgi:hypothetical protein